jgi:hypothetical protein
MVRDFFRKLYKKIKGEKDEVKSEGYEGSLNGDLYDIETGVISPIVRENPDYKTIPVWEIEKMNSDTKKFKVGLALDVTPLLSNEMQLNFAYSMKDTYEILDRSLKEVSHEYRSMSRKEKGDIRPTIISYLTMMAFLKENKGPSGKFSDNYYHRTDISIENMKRLAEHWGFLEQDD